MDGDNRSTGAASANRRGPGIDLGASSVAVVAGGGALVIWEPAFTLGAYNVVFYYQVLTLWAVSTGVLLSSLLLRERLPRHGWVYLACLALPSVWIGLAVIGPRKGLPRELLFLGGGILSVIGAPLLAWLLLRILLFGESELSERQQRRIVGTIAVVGVLAFTLGKLNPLFLTCGDFDISGNSVPKGCRPGSASPFG